MAAFTFSPATSFPSCSSNNAVQTKVVISMSARFETTGWERGTNLRCLSENITADHVPAMERRKLMNLLLFGAVGLPTAGVLLPYSAFFPSPRDGTVAKDEFGNSIIASKWLKTHEPGDKTLTQGLKGDPTYVVVEYNKTLATYGINAVCTHLGCIVPWNTVEEKFICPCHGSQFNHNGTVIKGPALQSLELTDVEIEDDQVMLHGGLRN